MKVWGRNKNKSNDYAEDVKKMYPNLEVEICESAKDAVIDADIIYTVTYSETPLVMSEWIKSGAHITAVGACEPTMQELESSILQLADIVCVDGIEACKENGELHHAIKSGLIETQNVIELGSAISKNIKRKPTDITVCDLVGIGFQDAVIASCVMNEYKKKTNNY